MPVFFITSSDIVDGVVTITDPLFSHLFKSLRVRRGDTLLLNDESGYQYHTTVLHIGSDSLQSTVQEIQGPPPSANTPPITLGQALLKREKMGWIIQKATELGVDNIAPLTSERVIPRLHIHHSTNQHARWEKIRLEAAQQSERRKLPKVLPLQLIEEFLGMQEQKGGLQIILAERTQGKSLSSIDLPEDPQADITLLVGPEGGWTKKELEAAQSHNFTLATLGSGILRAETASLASLAILQARLHNL